MTMGTQRARRFTTLGFVLAAGITMAADVSLTQEAAERCRQKLQTISANSLADARAPRVTSLDELEVNSYLKYLAEGQIPNGLVDPYITIEGEGRVSGRATVDLDAVKQERQSGGWFDPFRFLSGRLPVSATATLTATSGVGRFQIESAKVAGVPVPRSVLRDLVSHYTRTPENPAGFDLDDPFDLPLRIKAVQVGSTEAVIVQ